MKFSTFRAAIADAHFTGMARILAQIQSDPHTPDEVKQWAKESRFVHMMRAAASSYAEQEAKNLIGDDTEL